MLYTKAKLLQGDYSSFVTNPKGRIRTKRLPDSNQRRNGRTLAYGRRGSDASGI